MADIGDLWNGKKAYCYRCGHLWTVRQNRKPKMCPRCRSSRYDVPVMREHTCAFCGTSWKIKGLDDGCPECGRHIFDTADPMKHHCNQCDHIWVGRTDEMPAKCPLCNSTKWNDGKLNQFTCRKCGHVWRNKVDRPQRCPKCQSLKWDELTFKLQCRRCGHRWVTNGGRGSDEVRMCPACKSRKWNESPRLMYCNKCNSVYMPQSTGTKCPNCSSSRSRRMAIDHQCNFCGTTWKSTSEDAEVCPRCGTHLAKGGGNESPVVFWSEGGMKMTYLYSYDQGCVYLWKDGIPRNAMYIQDLLKRTGLKLGSLIQRAYDPRYDGFWRNLADELYEQRDDYRSNISYFMKRLGLEETDAEILALHFIGMSPEAIALRFGKPIECIRKSFDVIMSAYSDNGIVVNDNIFTEDPISLYNDG